MGFRPPTLEAEGFESNFSITYNPNTIDCPNEPSVNDIDEETEYHLESQDTILNPGCRVFSRYQLHSCHHGRILCFCNHRIIH